MDFSSHGHLHHARVGRKKCHQLSRQPQHSHFAELKSRRLRALERQWSSLEENQIQHWINPWMQRSWWKQKLGLSFWWFVLYLLQTFYCFLSYHQFYINLLDKNWHSVLGISLTWPFVPSKSCCQKFHHNELFPLFSFYCVHNSTSKNLVAFEMSSIWLPVFTDELMYATSL